jgi:uncharacterized protein YtpQ (UPF0354 family)
VLPQIVPMELVLSAPNLVSVPYVGDLAIAFVMDEAERYAYIHQGSLERWGMGDTDLLTLAVANLERVQAEGPPCCRIVRGDRTMITFESFDGYDASRVLLTHELERMALQVPGTPVIAMPHRDYLVVFGDANPDFVAEMTERVRSEYEYHNYRISSRLFTLEGGHLAEYAGTAECRRLLN